MDPFPLWCWRQWGSRPAVKNGKQVGVICTACVLQRSKDHPKKQLQNGVATAPRHWDRRGQHPPAGQSSSSQSLGWELDTVHSSPTSTDWKFPTQTNVHAARVLKPPTTSFNPVPSSMTWDARHGPVRWRPTGSFGDRLRHYGRLRTSPYSPDWKSSMARNAEEEVWKVCM